MLRNLLFALHVRYCEFKLKYWAPSYKTSESNASSNGQPHLRVLARLWQSLFFLAHQMAAHWRSSSAHCRSVYCSR